MHGVMPLGYAVSYPVGVPRANHALTHTFSGIQHTFGVGIYLTFYGLGCGRPQAMEWQKSDAPLFLCVE